MCTASQISTKISRKIRQTFGLTLFNARLTFFYITEIKKIAIDLKPFSYLLPVNQLPERSNMLRASVLIVQVIGMFPHIAG
jgi:hypothetical protein